MLGLVHCPAVGMWRCIWGITAAAMLAGAAMLVQLGGRLVVVLLAKELCMFATAGRVLSAP